ncbi:MAG: hypothetical protein IAG13_38285, partial [Deltaproteobacteria bacterium]|nr:hypothetical protein [Nannocystaceae bacterium]
MTHARSNWYRLAALGVLVAGCYDPEPPAPGPEQGAVTKADQPGESSDVEGCEDDEDCGEDQLCLLDAAECVDDETGRGCDAALQDCGVGFKCNPWAHDGGTAWTASQCVPIEPEPHAIGEGCTTHGGATSGFDDCVPGSACIFEVCVELCSGAGDAPKCASEDTHCRSYNDGALSLCEPICDPLAQNCGVGSG